MSKNFSGFRCFVGGVYSRDYPNPYLYTHAGPIGDIGLLALPDCRLARTPSPILILSLSFSRCLLVVCGGVAGSDRGRLNYSDNGYLGIS